MNAVVSPRPAVRAGRRRSAWALVVCLVAGCRDEAQPPESVGPSVAPTESAAPFEALQQVPDDFPVKHP